MSANRGAMAELGKAAEAAEDGLDPEVLEAALAQTPKGAFALAGLTVGLLMLAWLGMYLLVFLPRGEVG